MVMETIEKRIREKYPKLVLKLRGSDAAGFDLRYALRDKKDSDRRHLEITGYSLEEIGAEITKVHEGGDLELCFVAEGCYPLDMGADGGLPPQVIQAAEKLLSEEDEEEEVHTESDGSLARRVDRFRMGTAIKSIQKELKDFRCDFDDFREAQKKANAKTHEKLEEILGMLDPAKQGEISNE